MLLSNSKGKVTKKIFPTTKESNFYFIFYNNIDILFRNIKKKTTSLT